MIRHSLVAVLVAAASLGAQTQRPMTFLDAQNMRQASGPDLSPDGKTMLYTLSTPDWNQARRQSDIYLVSIDRGLPSTRQLTFTKDKNETNPQVVARRKLHRVPVRSRRDRRRAGGRRRAAGGGRGGGGGGGGRNQLFVMRLDGGEAKRVTDTREGVSNFSFTKDGKSIVYTSGRTDDEQIYALADRRPLDRATSRSATQLTRHATGVGNWQWSPDGKRIYFVTPDSIDRDERVAHRKAVHREAAQSRRRRSPSLWVVRRRHEAGAPADERRDLQRRRRHASRPTASGSATTACRPAGTSAATSSRTTTPICICSNVASGKIERLTKNDIISEGARQLLARQQARRLLGAGRFQVHAQSSASTCATSISRREPWKKLGGNFDDDVRVGGRGGGGGDDGVETSFWSANGDTIYFGTGVHATTQFFARRVATGEVKQITDLKGDDSGGARRRDRAAFIITYADPKTPPATYTVGVARATSAIASKWTQLTDPNPWVRREIALGDEEEITWKSTDGTHG